MATNTSFSNLSILLISLINILLVITTTIIPSASSQLTTSFYATTCPSAFDTVRTATRAAINREPRMGALLLRLFFHDCFVNGCDGGILLDDIAGSFVGEQSAPANQALLRSLKIVDDIKAQVDTACGGSVVSCADILAISTRDSIVQLGGPTYSVPVGRRDAITANLNGARNEIPAFFEDAASIIRKFQNKGFTAREMVALSGAHSVGQARCVTFRDRIYDPNSNIDPDFATSRKANCPQAAGSGDDNIAPLDPQSPNRFGNNYFQALLVKRGLLNSDQTLFNGTGTTDDFVRTYASNANVFNTDFANAMFKMGNVSPLTGSQGEVRTNCGRVN